MTIHIQCRHRVTFTIAALVLATGCEPANEPMAPTVRMGPSMNTSQETASGVGTLGSGNAQTTTQDTAPERGAVGTIGSGRNAGGTFTLARGDLGGNTQIVQEQKELQSRAVERGVSVVYARPAWFARAAGGPRGGGARSAQGQGSVFTLSPVAAPGYATR